MAEYTAASGDIGVYSKTLVANTVDTVVLTGHAGNVEIISNGAAKVFLTLDGSAPTVNGANTHELPALVSLRVLRNPEQAAPTTVKLISAGTPEYSVAKAGADQ